MAMSLVQSDFVGLGQIATHCDLTKLQVAINEAIEFDMKPLLCNLFGQIDENWEEEELAGPNYTVISPGSYENCAGFNTTHQGLKKVLAYFAYSRYTFMNPFNDTPNGAVDKTNPFSIPKPLAEIKQYSNKYKNMAKEAFKYVEAYILLNKDGYPGFPVSELKTCGCNGACGTKGNTKGFGIKSRIISRYE